MINVAITLTVLLFLSALFSGAETAYTGLSSTKVEVVKNDGKFGSHIIFWLYSRLDSVITVNLIVSNLVNIYISAYVTLIATELFPGGEGVAYAVATATVLILLFGEILPKKIAIIAPVAFSRFSAYILYALYHILYPIVLPLSKFMNVFDRYAAKKGKSECDVSEEEIHAMLDLGIKDGALESKEYEMIKKLLAFNDRQVKDIMTRRTDVIAIKDTTTLRELLDISAEHRHSRFPVYKEDISTCDWVTYIPKFIPYLTQKGNLEKEIKSFGMDKALKVPESKIIDDLFFEFQQKRVHLAIVVDEFGETSGIITLEDIVEAVFGEIEDETDKQAVRIKKMDDKTRLVDGDVSLEDIEEELAIHISSDDFPPEKTIGWLVLEKLHRFPVAGEKIGHLDGHITITVMDMDGEYIDKVEIRVNKMVV